MRDKIPSPRGSARVKASYVSYLFILFDALFEPPFFTPIRVCVSCVIIFGCLFVGHALCGHVMSSSHPPSGKNTPCQESNVKASQGVPEGASNGVTEERSTSGKNTPCQVNTNKGLPERHVVRRWVVVVDIQAPQRLLLCVLPHAKSNFGAIVLDALHKARQRTKYNCDVQGTFFYEDVGEALVLPLKSVTTRSKTHAIMAGCFPGTVVYFYAATKLPPTEEINKAVHAWKQTHTCDFEAALKSISDSTIADASDPSTALFVQASSNTGLTITVVPVPAQASHTAPTQKPDQAANNKNNYTEVCANTLDKNMQGSVQPIKRKHNEPGRDTARVVAQLECAILQRIETVQRVEQAEQNLEKAKRQHLEAQQLVETLKKTLLKL